MRPRLTTNAADLFRRMLNRRAAVERELQGAARTIARVLVRRDKQILQEKIYNVPIPLKKSANARLSPTAALRKRTTKGSAGQWQRTGALKRAETVTVEGMSVVLRNNQKYAVARNNLGAPGGRQIRSPGVQSVQWQQEAIASELETIRGERRKAVLRALRRR